ncbi:hypothetical protein C8Q76DRAFT_613658, partial [Earliella scabrosa]
YCGLFLCRCALDPQVGHYVISKVAFDNQWFTLLHGTGDRAGSFAIQGCKSGRVLKSRSHTEPRMGHVDGDGAYGDK